MKNLNQSSRGFTIVELVVVIVVIGVLAVLTTVGYRGYLNQTNFARTNSDLQQINLAIEKFYAKNGSYPMPSRGNNIWSSRTTDGQDFIVGLRPEYLATVPDIETRVVGDTDNDTYIYRSNGRDYKLIRLAATGQSVPDHEKNSVPLELQDPFRWEAGTPQYRGWGYWSSGAAGW